MTLLNIKMIYFRINSEEKTTSSTWFPHFFLLEITEILQVTIIAVCTLEQYALCPTHTWSMTHSHWHIKRHTYHTISLFALTVITSWYLYISLNYSVSFSVYDRKLWASSRSIIIDCTLLHFIISSSLVTILLQYNVIAACIWIY